MKVKKMKFDLCRQLFNRRRRLQQKFKFLLLTLSLLGVYLLYKEHNSQINNEESRTTKSIPLLSSPCHCSKKSLEIYEYGECFFDKLVCYPGFDGKYCNTSITNETYRTHCPMDIHRVQWTRSLIRQLKTNCSQSEAARREWNSSCIFLCFYHRSTGIIQVPDPFWKVSLNNELKYWIQNNLTLDDRILEHVEGFQGYIEVPLQIESIVEVGAGPFTQLQYLITPFRSIGRITIIEPNALRYMTLNNCAYKGGHLKGHPISIITESIEVHMQKRRQNNSQSSKQYSIVMSINVVEHVSDALEYFRGLFDLLTQNGLIIFHERWFSHPQQGDCILDSAERLHPVRITRWLLDIFLAQFEPIYINYNQTWRQIHTPCGEQSVYFIGRKKPICVG